MRIVGFDPGLSSFGVAIIAVDKAGEARVEALKVIRTQRSAKKRHLRAVDDLADRLKTIAAALQTVLTAPDVIAIAIEGGVLPFRKIRPSVVSALGRARGLVDMLAVIHSLAVVELTPQETKLALAGKRSASKAEVQLGVEGRCPETQTMWPKQRTLIEHASDAAAVALAALDSSDVIKAALRTAASFHAP